MAQSLEALRQNELKKRKKLQKEMDKQRKNLLMAANEDEDKTIRQLEKQLKLKKGKSKAIPKSFVMDGLDFLLEVCDSEKLHNLAMTERNLSKGKDDFEEDFALMTDPGTKVNPSEAELDEGSEVGGFSDETEDELDARNEDFSKRGDKKRKKEVSASLKKSKKMKTLVDDVPDDDDDDDGNCQEQIPENGSQHCDGTYEDIYGRLRNKDGSVVNKYVPPAQRAALDVEDNSRSEKLKFLQRQLKGLLNRLTENNMHFICTQIEDLYMKNSRNDMNTTLTDLILKTLVTHISTPERLLLEYAVLVAVLHANVGTEVGAYFMQTVVKQFDDTLKKTEGEDVDNKVLQNLVGVITQIYNFKICDAKLIYEIIGVLARNFTETNIDCILIVLKNVGLMLRKDGPLELKSLILDLQKRAAKASEEETDNARVKFMLDILLAIKNNNVRKIPNYDIEHSEHLKKLMKGFIRKGNYTTTLNISLGELLSAEERGRWWVVGSTWKGKDVPETTRISDGGRCSTAFSSKLLELARKNKMNTDTRRNIFCIIMSAEDYLDAFFQLIRLGLKNQQEREIVDVLLHCALQERSSNPYYSVLAQKFCEYDRRFQMIIKYAVWDKLKALDDRSSGNLLSNLTKLLTHLILQKGLSISVLKVVEFSELDQISLRFTRQILIGILLHDDLEMVLGVFERVSKGDKLKMFRESLRLFLHHFLLKNLKATVSLEQKKLLEARIQIVEKVLKRREVVNFE